MNYLLSCVRSFWHRQAWSFIAVLQLAHFVLAATRRVGFSFPNQGSIKPRSCAPKGSFLTTQQSGKPRFTGLNYAGRVSAVTYCLCLFVFFLHSWLSWVKPTTRRVLQIPGRLAVIEHDWFITNWCPKEQASAPTSALCPSRAKPPASIQRCSSLLPGY